MPHSQQAQALQQLQGHPVSKEIQRMCHSNASDASVASSRQGVPPPPPAAAYPWPEVGPGGTWRDVAGHGARKLSNSWDSLGLLESAQEGVEGVPEGPAAAPDPGAG